jgi:hypothetical protein
VKTHPIVVVLAPTQAEARATARELGYAPYGREVLTVSRPEQLHGWDLADDDHVVWSRLDGWRARTLEDVAQNLEVASFTARRGPRHDVWSRA